MDQKEIVKRISENQKIIYKICNSYCYNKSDREDLGQEIVYQLIKSRNIYNSKFQFTTWMYRVALNVAISFYRSGKKEDVVELVESHEDAEDTTHEGVSAEDNFRALQQFINELKELDKAIMILYLESKSYKEIAEVIGISETNVATRINRIKKVLTQKFSNHNLK